MNNKIVIIGANSTIAELCAREWMKRPNTEMILVGRNNDQLQIIAQDLSIRAPNNCISILSFDFNNPQIIAEQCKAICLKRTPDIVLIAHGILPNQKECQSDLKKCNDSMHINGVSPVLFAEAFAGEMEKINQGTIAIIGSVAGERGRKSNYIYGAAKGLIAHYIEGMQHRFYASKVRIILIEPGPTLTKMTANLEKQGIKLSDPASVAYLMVKGIAKGKSLIYAPRRWKWIMFVIRHLPNFLFNRSSL